MGAVASNCRAGDRSQARQVKADVVLAGAAQEPRLRGGSFVAVALHATAGLASNRFPASCRLGLTRME